MSDPIRDNMSMANPTDMAAMKQSKDAGMGQFAGMDKGTTVRDFFGKLGVDVDGPVTQLAELAKNQMKKGNPLGKMASMAEPPAGPGPRPQPPGGPGGPPPMPPPGGPGGEPGLDGLMT